MHVSLGHVIYDLLLRQISASICGQFGEMINSISARVFDERGRIYLYFINPWAHTTRYRQIFHFAAVAFRAAIRLNTLSPLTMWRYSPERFRPRANYKSDNRHTTVPWACVLERARACVRACMCARVYLCTHAYTFSRTVVAFFSISISF